MPFYLEWVVGIGPEQKDMEMAGLAVGSGTSIRGFGMAVLISAFIISNTA